MSNSHSLSMLIITINIATIKQIKDSNNSKNNKIIINTINIIKREDSKINNSNSNSIIGIIAIFRISIHQVNLCSPNNLNLIMKRIDTMTAIDIREEITEVISRLARVDLNQSDHPHPRLNKSSMILEKMIAISTNNNQQLRDWTHIRKENKFMRKRLILKNLANQIKEINQLGLLIDWSNSNSNSNNTLKDSMKGKIMIILE